MKRQLAANLMVTALCIEYIDIYHILTYSSKQFAVAVYFFEREMGIYYNERSIYLAIFSTYFLLQRTKLPS